MGKTKQDKQIDRAYYNMFSKYKLSNGSMWLSGKIIFREGIKWSERQQAKHLEELVRKIDACIWGQQEVWVRPSLDTEERIKGVMKMLKEEKK